MALMTLKEPEPVLVADRFPALLDTLLNLLDGLSDEEWQRPVHGWEWTVKDLAQHLLGDEINILSARRDGFSGAHIPVNTWDELVVLINRHNQNWVEATRRMSPRVVCDLLRLTGDQANETFRAMEPYTIVGPVNWAGPDPAPLWLDVAREFTERWHHQQHIRDAVQKPGCTEPFYLAPVLAAFAYALPETFRQVDAPEGTGITLTVTGEAGGIWSVVRAADTWQFYRGRPEQPQAEVELPQEIAWRLFTRGLSKTDARSHARLHGDPRLADKVLDTVAIIA
jgi:uncharacterized protein (TIGR03083 family)